MINRLFNSYRRHTEPVYRLTPYQEKRIELLEELEALNPDVAFLQEVINQVRGEVPHVV